MRVAAQRGKQESLCMAKPFDANQSAYCIICFCFF